MGVSFDRPPHRRLRPVRLIYEEFVRSLTYHWIYYLSGKACEAGSMVYRPFPRKSESLTVCRCYYESSTFSSVMLRSWVLIWPGFEPTVCLSADRWLSYRASRSTVYFKEKIVFYTRNKNKFRPLIIIPPAKWPYWKRSCFLFYCTLAKKFQQYFDFNSKFFIIIFSFSVCFCVR